MEMAIEYRDLLLQIKELEEEILLGIEDKFEQFHKIKPAPEAETPEQPKPKRNTKRLDRGKISALRAAGWTFAKIAEEMDCNVNTVYRIVQELESMKEVQDEAHD